MTIDRRFTLPPRMPQQTFEDWATACLQELERISQEGGQLEPVSIDLDNLSDGDYLGFDATNGIWTALDAVPGSFEPSDGDKGDITVSSSGTAWAIDDSAVTTAKVNDGAVTFAKLDSAVAASAAEVQSGTADKFITPAIVETASEPETITEASPTTWDWSTVINGELTLTADRTLSFPSNVEPGTWRAIRVIQNGTGGWTLSLATSAGYYSVNGSNLGLDETASTAAVLFFWAVSTSVVYVFPNNGPFQQVTT